MMIEVLKRRQLEEKQALHNITISVPFFISKRPTTLVAVSKDNDLTRSYSHHQKIHYNGSKVVCSKIISFPSVEVAQLFYQRYQERAKSQPGLWCEYCQDLTRMEGILYQTGKIYVMNFENKEWRDFLNEVSQLVAVDGASMQELMRRQESPLFRFLEEETISLEHLYFRWRVYSYLQGDGQKRFPTQPFSIVEGGHLWYPPVPGSIPRGVLNHTQRKYFHELLFRLTRRKKDIEEAMVFSIFNMHCAVQIVTCITLQIFQTLQEDFIKYFYLITDILFNTTTENYRRLFARIIPFIVYGYSKRLFSREGQNKELDSKYKGELKALIQIWQIKFLFDDNYTKGLMFLMNHFEHQSSIKVHGIHQKLKDIGSFEDQQESEVELERICFANGIPLMQNDKEQCMKILNQYLWSSQKQESIVPQPVEAEDGQPLTDKEILKIRNKQVKAVCCEGLSISMLAEKSTWRNRGNLSNSVDET